MSRAALTLETLAKDWAKGEIDELVICGHPAGRVSIPGSSYTQVERWYYCLYARRAGTWQVVREAQASALRARTWWALDACLKVLATRGIVPRELRVLPHGPVPEGFPALPPETTPTVSARRKAPAAPEAPLVYKVRPGVRRAAAAWLDDNEPEQGASADPAAPAAGAARDPFDEDW